MPLFVVDTISTIRCRYIIDCETLDHAYDTVASDEAKEFSQLNVGEQIVSGYQITLGKFTRMNDALKSHGDGTPHNPEIGNHWLGDQAITVVKY